MLVALVECSHWLRNAGKDVPSEAGDWDEFQLRAAVEKFQFPQVWDLSVMLN